MRYRSIKSSNNYTKANFYTSDGYGNNVLDQNCRDTYISSDNGGLTIAHSLQPVTRGGVYMKTSHRQQGPRPATAIKNVHYSLDGTGRDNYVLYQFLQYNFDSVNDGGLLQGKSFTIPPNKLFTKLLRSQLFAHELNNSVNDKYYSKVLFPIPTQTHTDQRKSITRLSAPKRKDEKFQTKVQRAFSLFQTEQTEQRLSRRYQSSLQML